MAPQHASVLGKTANCQTLVALTLASGEVPVMVGLRLFLPENWTRDADRMARARIPADHQAFRRKPEIAIGEVDRMRAAGVRFGCVLADAGCGMSAAFRHALSERGLHWAVGIARHQKVYPGDVALIFPVAGRGRPRLRHIPDRRSISAEADACGAWRSVSWRRGTKGRLSARFSAVRVQVADGSRQRIRDMGGQHMPGEEAWLIGERRSGGWRARRSAPANDHSRLHLVYVGEIRTDRELQAEADPLVAIIGNVEVLVHSAADGPAQHKVQLRAGAAPSLPWALLGTSAAD